MFNRNALRAEMARNGKTQAECAKAINVSNSTFSRKMRTGEFTLGEADGLINYLGIATPDTVFFAKKPT